jgi:hypothetical protein
MMSLSRSIASAVLIAVVACDESVGPPSADRIEITASQDSLHFISSGLPPRPGDTVHLMAMVTDDDGREYTGDSVVWSDNSMYVAVRPTGPRTAVATMGYFVADPVVEARLGELTATKTFATCPIRQVMIQNSAVMIAGREGTITAASNTGDGISSGVISSTDPSVVEVRGTSLVALRPGTAKLHAELCRQQDSIRVTVIEAGYQVTSVPLPSPLSSSPILSNTGEVIALSPSAQGLRYSWNRGTLTSTYLDGCESIQANTRGQVLCRGNGPRIWENGQASERDTVTFPNGGGQLTDGGHVFARSANGVAFVWRAPGNVVWTTCSFTLCTYGSGTNSRGDKLFGSGGGYERPVIWRASIGPSTYAALGYYGRYGHATALNDSTDAVGWSEFPTGHNMKVALLWPRSGGTLMLRPVNLWSPRGNDVAQTAVAINNRREIIGHGTRGPFIYSNGDLSLLNELLADTAWSIVSVIRINDLGQILATATNSATNYAGFVVMEPPTAMRP